ncbi:efflux RND transporter periplasmic adaptor subunit [Aidingimonas halophila]|uniref:RND family efflux transporter, MFP subunit n=1 Tax=Aidingimonas halophila TaxID=574349 RepID=A0A1H3FN02_9GAMM|nr:efflux RND transporter periplasmic adaptor subunit [Aidingimonas halophila]GHC38202.1 RND transporter [Aidingimonas halophila]SDX92422.1 RND family efflux transporter, MFP subunit [Aidingimonas halophila]
MPIDKPVSLTCTLLMGLALLLMGCSPETTSPPDIPTVVDSHTIQTDGGQRIGRFSGQVQAAEQTTLSFEIAGELESVAVDVGDDFSAGETLATIDDERYRLVAQQRRAEAREAEASLKEKRQDYQRQSELVQKEYVSASQFDAAQAALDTAESRHAAAIAARELADRDLTLTTLHAPFDGSVSQRQAEPAERVSASQPILEVISDRNGFEVEATVPETLVDALEVGSTHRVSLPALNGAESPATLSHLGSQPRSSNDYPIILELDMPPPGLHSGMTARVALFLDTPTDGTQAYPIPLTALKYDTDKQAHVLRIDGDERLERVDVEVVDIGDGRARVSGALSSGDRIVARGAEFLHPGQQVSLLGEGPERYN